MPALPGLGSLSGRGVAAVASHPGSAVGAIRRSAATVRSSPRRLWYIQYHLKVYSVYIYHTDSRSRRRVPSADCRVAARTPFSLLRSPYTCGMLFVVTLRWSLRCAHAWAPRARRSTTPPAECSIRAGAGTPHWPATVVCPSISEGEYTLSHTGRGHDYLWLACIGEITKHIKCRAYGVRHPPRSSRLTRGLKRARPVWLPAPPAPGRALAARRRLARVELR